MPLRSLETKASSVYARMPLRLALPEASLMARLTSSAVTPRLSWTVKSTTETVGVGTRNAMPVNLPLSSGITKPTAFAAPVLAGTMRRRARIALILRCQVEQLLRIGHCVHGGQQALDEAKLVVEDLATGARPLVVQDAFETT